MPLAGLPSHFGLGLSSKSTGTTDLSWMKDSGIAWDYRYIYTAGATNSASEGNQSSVYVSDGLNNGYIPVITRFTGISPLSNLQNTSFMNAYYADFVTQLIDMKNWNLWYLQKSGASSVTLSDDNATATFTGTSGTDNPVLSGNYHGTGKWAVRFHVNTAAGGIGFGLATNAPASRADLGEDPGSFGFYAGGLLVNGSFFAQPAFTFADGDNIDMLVNLDTKLLWARQNGGNWNNNGTANPATGVGGVSISAMTFPNKFSPAADLKTNGDAVSFGTAPTISGFPAWNSSPASPTMIMHVEPDLWGYMQSGGVSGVQTDDPTQVVVSVASSGYPGLGGLPNTAAGFAQALKLLRDANAPGVYLAWHCSTWGPQDGFTATNTSFNETPAATGARIANFYNGLNAAFDLIFHDTTTGDADSDYGVLVRGQTAAFAWWNAVAFENYRSLLASFHSHLTTPKDGILWQIAIGNTLYKSCNNTSFHYQDNKVEFFLTAGVGVAQSAIYNANGIKNYIASNIIGILFGPGQATDTENYDYAGDGITNPAPITNGNGQSGNNVTALYSDDDGGFLRLAAAHYYLSPQSLVTPTKTHPGHHPAPIGGGIPAHKGDYAPVRWVRKIIDVVNQHLQGKLNVTLAATLQSGSTATIIRDARISAFSGLLFTPLTANAAALADSIYVTTQGDGEVILAHNLVGSGDCTFTVCIIG